jgi:hypothetical protein
MRFTFGNPNHWRMHLRWQEMFKVKIWLWLLEGPILTFVAHYNCLLIKTIKCHINCQPREVCLFQRQSHTVYAQSQKQSKVVVKVTLITPCLEHIEVLP